MSSTAHSNPVVHVGGSSPTRSVPTSNRVMAFWETMIGKKGVMAVTGIVLVGFVIGHMGAI